MLCCVGGVVVANVSVVCIAVIFRLKQSKKVNFIYFVTAVSLHHSFDIIFKFSVF
jgi:hypothetical protein